MRIKQLLTKTILAAVGLGMGASAWADDITSLPFSKTWISTDAADATSPFSAGSVKTGGNITALSVNNTTATAYFDSDTGTDGKQAYVLATDEEVTVSLTAYHGWLTKGKDQGVKLINSQGNVIAEYIYNVGNCNITDVKIGGSTSSDFSAAYNGQSTRSNGGTNGANGFTNNNYVTTDGYNPVITFTVRYDGYVTLNITQEQRSIDNTYTGNLPAEWNIDIASIQAYAGSDNADRTLAINNLNITRAVAARANYTVKYVDSEDNKIDEDVVYSGVIGGTPSLITADKANRYNALGTLKYVYASDDASTKTVASDGSTVVTVRFTSFGKYDYSVTASNGATIESGSLFDDETKTISWSKYIEKDGTYYQATAPFQFTVTKDATSKEVSVTASQVKQFVETTSSNWATTGVENANLSGGNAWRGVAAGGTKEMLTVTEPGIYSINYAVFSTNTGTGKEFDFSLYKNDASVDANLIETFSVNHSVSYVLTTGTRTIENVQLMAGDKIIAKAGNTTCALDYIALAKTADYTVSVEVSAAGMATYVPAYDLDFTDTDIKAYTAKVNSTATCTLTEIKKVPAGTPVLLIGTTDDIPVAASTDAVGDNDLVAGTGAAVETTDGDYTNMILNNVGGKVGFYFANGKTVATNRAYLHFASSYAPSASAPMMLVFADDVVTGINTVNGSAVKANGSEGFYNLSGQRVAKPTKGLYIVNGKKVVVK